MSNLQTASLSSLAFPSLTLAASASSPALSVVSASAAQHDHPRLLLIDNISAFYWSLVCVSNARMLGFYEKLAVAN
jgi:hypothetical protein